MAYNYYPTSYQMPAYYPQQQVNNPFQNGNSSHQNNGMNWVVGENGADSFLVAPGQTVTLWDSTAPVFYLKTADAMGRPSKKVFDYTERSALPQEAQNRSVSEYATKEDISIIRDEIESLRAKFEVKEGGKK